LKNLWVEARGFQCDGDGGAGGFCRDAVDFYGCVGLPPALVGCTGSVGSIVEAFWRVGERGRFFIKMSSDLAAKLDILPGDEIVALGASRWKRWSYGRCGVRFRRW